jgi:carbon-monoxide dehydrogenase medium subunit
MGMSIISLDFDREQQGRIMKPAAFDYHVPDSIDEALALLANTGEDAKLLAGGQSLIPAMNFRLAQPSCLIDLNRIGELDYITPTQDGGLGIGALTRQRQLERESEVVRRAPLIAEAMPFIAHPQIRNRGTVGGNLAHADPASELPAIAIALEASFELRGPSGSRTVPASEFFTGLFDTALESDEMLIELRVPPLPANTGWAFDEVARRHGDYAQVGVTAVVGLDGSHRCKDIRLVFLSVSDRPVTATSAAGSLEGEEPSDEAIAAAAAAAASELEPGDDIHATAAFKKHLAEVLARRVLRRAVDRAKGVER